MKGLWQSLKYLRLPEWLFPPKKSLPWCHLRNKNAPKRHIFQLHCVAASHGMNSDVPWRPNKIKRETRYEQANVVTYPSMRPRLNSVSKKHLTEQTTNIWCGLMESKSHNAQWLQRYNKMQAKHVFLNKLTSRALRRDKQPCLLLHGFITEL